MGRAATIEATDDGGFYLSYLDPISGRHRTGTAKDFGHAVDKLYEVFEAERSKPDPKAATARANVEKLTIAHEKHEAAQAAGRTPRVNVTGPFPTAKATAKRLGLSKTEAARLSKLADSAISALGATRAKASKG